MASNNILAGLFDNFKALMTEPETLIGPDGRISATRLLVPGFREEKKAEADRKRKLEELMLQEQGARARDAIMKNLFSQAGMIQQQGNSPSQVRDALIGRGVDPTMANDAAQGFALQAQERSKAADTVGGLLAESEGKDFDSLSPDERVEFKDKGFALQEGSDETRGVIRSMLTDRVRHRTRMAELDAREASQRSLISARESSQKRVAEHRDDLQRDTSRRNSRRAEAKAQRTTVFNAAFDAEMDVLTQPEASTGSVAGSFVSGGAGKGKRTPSRIEVINAAKKAEEIARNIVPRLNNRDALVRRNKVKERAKAMGEEGASASEAVVRIGLEDGDTETLSTWLAPGEGDRKEALRKKMAYLIAIVQEGKVTGLDPTSLDLEVLAREAGYSEQEFLEVFEELRAEIANAG